MAGEEVEIALRKFKGNSAQQQDFAALELLATLADAVSGA
jgi:hypothetical protein